MPLTTNNSTLSSNAPHSYWTKKFWASFLAYTKNFNSDNPANFKYEVNKTLSDEITDLTEFLTHFASTRSNFLRNSAQKHLSRNYMDFLSIYKKIVAESEKDPSFLEFTPYTYSYDKEEFRTQFLIELINDTRYLNPNMQPGSNEEIKVLEANLGKLDKEFEKRLKESYIDLIVRLGQFLIKFNLTEDYANSFSNMLNGYNLKGLAYPASEDEPSCQSINSIFSGNFLRNLKLPKLIALAGFWINKTAKSIVTLNETLFIINEFDLWDDIRARKKHLTLDDDKFRAVLEKTSRLSKLEDNIFEIMETLQFEHPTLSPEEINTIFSKHFHKKIEQQSARYKRRFDTLLPTSKNNLNHDLTAIHAMSNTRYLLYRLKDICIFNLIMGCIDSHYSQNWGIISDEDNKFVNISFDIEGLNMPLRLHLYKQELINFLKDYTAETIIPIYAGDKDLTINGTYIPTIILAPICQKQSNFINEYSKEITQELRQPENLNSYIISLYKDTLKFLEHIKFLKNKSKTPSSFADMRDTLPNALNIETGEKIHIKSKKKNR